MMSYIINLNDSYGSWENDFSEQNLIGIKEPDTECEILAKISAHEYAFYSYGPYRDWETDRKSVV